MQSMSFDPAVADIGSQVVNNAFQGLQAGAVAWVSLSSLLPAGAEEVSAWAVTAFTTAATGLLALNQAAQEELRKAGECLPRSPGCIRTPTSGRPPACSKQFRDRPDPRAGIVRRDARRIS